jgi:hypothetical protein
VSLSPFVYQPGERLSHAELTAACLDGHLVALGDAFVPADVVETVALRAASLTRMLGASLAATHTSAAWVHGGIDDPPPRHTVQRAVPWRLHHIIDRRLIYRDPFVPDEDRSRLGGAWVTTIGRTIGDLARTPDDRFARALGVWARRDPSVVAQGISWLDAHPGMPHRRTALATLASLRTT